MHKVEVLYVLSLFLCGKSKKEVNLLLSIAFLIYDILLKYILSNI